MDAGVLDAGELSAVTSRVAGGTRPDGRVPGGGREHRAIPLPAAFASYNAMSAMVRKLSALSPSSGQQAKPMLTEMETGTGPPRS